MPEHDTSQYVALKQKVQSAMPMRQEYTDADVEQTIYHVLAQEAHEDYTNVRERVSIGRRIFHAMRRLDVLQPYLEDPQITEIMVNGPDHIFIEKEGRPDGNSVRIRDPTGRCDPADRRHGEPYRQ